MTETHPTTPADRPVFPPGRYGRRREPRRHRWVAALLAVVVAAAGVAAAVRLYRLYGDPAYEATLVRYTDVTDSGIVLEFRVNVPPGRSARCVVRARNEAGVEVGRAEVTAGPVADGQPTVRYALATSDRPVTGEVLRCRPAGD